jgi:hypothetical protein
VHRRVPSAGHRQQIALGAHYFAAGIDFGRNDSPFSADRTPHHAALVKRCAGSACSGAQHVARLGPWVDDRCDRDARSRKVVDGSGRFIRRREHHRPPARQDRKTIDVSTNRARQHYAGPIVVAEHERPLDRAGGQNRGAGINSPQALTRLVGGRWDVIGDAFDGRVIAVVVCGDDSRPPQDRHVREACEFRFDIGDPCDCRCAVDDIIFRQKPSAECEILFADRHARSATRGDKRRHETGRSSANNE